MEPISFYRGLWRQAWSMDPILFMEYCYSSELRPCTLGPDPLAGTALIWMAETAQLEIRYTVAYTNFPQLW